MLLPVVPPRPLPEKGRVLGRLFEIERSAKENKAFRAAKIVTAARPRQGPPRPVKCW
jgi:hypothetical protein